MDEKLFYLILGGIIGIVIMTAVFLVGLKLIKAFFKNTKLIKNYWMFVLAFSILFVGAYWYILSMSMSAEDKNIVISVANQVSGLIFAVFTGYFAFSQIMEGRFAKLSEDGLELQRKKDYTESIKAWEGALAIKRKDFSVLANLLEAYAMQERYNQVEEKIDLLKKISPPERAEVPSIIIVSMRIFQGRINDAKEAITETIKVIKNKNDAFYTQRWYFDDAVDSPIYAKLDGEAKVLFDNFSRYIQNQMPEDERVKFESGDYLLKNK